MKIPVESLESGRSSLLELLNASQNETGAKKRQNCGCSSGSNSKSEPLVGLRPTERLAAMRLSDDSDQNMLKRLWMPSAPASQAKTMKAHETSVIV